MGLVSQTYSWDEMKPHLLQKLEILNKALEAEGYEIRGTIKGQKNLLINIKLKENDWVDITKVWSEARKIPNG